jgi:hypothetical protein
VEPKMCFPLGKSRGQSCITCKMVPRERQSDKCNQCQLAVFNM